MAGKFRTGIQTGTIVPLFHLGSNFSLFRWVLGVLGCFGQFRPVWVEVMGPIQRERKRGFEVWVWCERVLVWDREKSKGENKFNTCLFVFSIKKEVVSRRRAGQFSIVLQSFERHRTLNLKELREQRCGMGSGVGRVINGGRYLDKFIVFLFNNLLLQELLSIFLIMLLGCVLHTW